MEITELREQYKKETEDAECYVHGKDILTNDDTIEGFQLDYGDWLETYLIRQGASLKAQGERIKRLEEAILTYHLQDDFDGDERCIYCEEYPNYEGVVDHDPSCIVATLQGERKEQGT